MKPKTNRSQMSDGQAAPSTITFMSEQFQQFMQQIMNTRDSNAGPSSEVLRQSSGNFVNCNYRFSGNPNDDVDAFLDAITTYKDCACVTDSNALRGLPMLLEGIAAKWWKGVKSSMKDWDSAVNALRDAYSRTLPPHLIFREIFSREQSSDEPTEHFVCHIRSLIAQLPYVVEETMQIDMVYGLLKREIRQRITRAEITSYNVLMTRTRELEVTIRELNSAKMPVCEKQIKHYEEVKKNRPKCSYCKIIGHMEADCRKLAKQTEASVTISAKTTDKLRCFQCNAPGYIKSNCPKCNPKTIEAVDLSSVTNASPQDERPIVMISIEGHRSIACLETGAKVSLAGSQLYNLLSKKNALFEEKQKKRLH